MYEDADRTVYLDVPYGGPRDWKVAVQVFPHDDLASEEKSIAGWIANAVALLGEVGLYVGRRQVGRLARHISRWPRIGRTALRTRRR